MPPKDIKKQIDEAERLCFEIRRLSKPGAHVGLDRLPLWDARQGVLLGRIPTGGAKDIARFLRKHRDHIEQQKEGGR